jgi:hypothetical protein
MNASIISKGLAHECDGWHCVDDSGTAKLPPAEDRLGEEAFRAMDRMREALSAQITGGLSPALLALAFMDWSIHLASAPGKCAEIIFKADRKIGRLAAHAAAIGIATDDCPCIEPLPGDYRFVSDTWRKPPYSLWAQAFLLNQQWWHNVTHKVAGVTPHHEEVVLCRAPVPRHVFTIEYSVRQSRGGREDDQEWRTEFRPRLSELAQGCKPACNAATARGYQ